MPGPSSLIVLLRQNADAGAAAPTPAWIPAGYEVRSWHLASSAQAEEAFKSIPAEAKAFILIGEDDAWIKATVGAIRTSALRFLPILSWFDTKAIPDVATLVSCGVDDFLSMAERNEVNAARISMRLSEFTVRSDADKAFKEQLLQVAKADTTLKQREEFLSVCAHDLRSPLGLIQSSLKLLLGSPDPKAPLSSLHLELIERCQRQAGHAITLVNDLLDVTSYEQGLKPRYELTNLHRLLERFVKDYGFQAQQKQIEVHYDNPVPNWRVLVDTDRVQQLLQNLFSNAIKFTEQGKNIFLKVSAFQGRRKADPPYPMIVISLRDEGQGIPRDELQKIFDRFSQIKSHSRADGRGLGLTVAKQISTLHDGNLWVQSEEGKGSTFFVLFPHVISRTSSPAKAWPAKRILVAEPSVAKQEEAYNQLRAWGYELIFARDGVEAVTLLFHHWPDALILGSDLTKMSPEEVGSIVKNDPLGNGIPILSCAGPGHSIPCDAELTLPLSHSQWNAALAGVQKRRKRAA